MKQRLVLVLSVALFLAIIPFTTVTLGNTLIYGKSSPAIALDPGAVDEGGSSTVVSQIFESLLNYKPGSTEIIPSLAKDWKISADGKTITFYLRRGVKFHDGTPMNADAVVFSFARQHFKDHPYYKFGPWKYWNSSHFSDSYKKDGSLKKKGMIKDIRKVDDYTVNLTLEKPDASILVNFCLYFTSIVSPTAVKKYGADFKKHPVGTGPFVFQKWVKDDYVMLKKNRNYWDKPAGTKRVVFKVYPDATARTMALIKGEADIIDPPDYDNLVRLKNEKNIKIQYKDGLSIGYLSMNVERKPFNNKLVRQAFNHAINRQEIIDGVYGVLGSKNDLPIPTGLWSYDRSIAPYEYNPQKAKQLLKQAGYGKGFKMELFALPVSRPYNPNGQKVGEIIQAQLKKVGIDAKIVSYEIGTYWDKVDAGQFDVCMTGWSGEPDPNDFLLRLFTSGYLNSGRWKNQQYIETVSNARLVSDVKQRTRLYQQAQALIHDEAPIVMLANAVFAAPMNKRVKGYLIYPTNKLVLKHVTLED